MSLLISIQQDSILLVGGMDPPEMPAMVFKWKRVKGESM